MTFNSLCKNVSGDTNGEDETRECSSACGVDNEDDGASVNVLLQVENCIDCSDSEHTYLALFQESRKLISDCLRKISFWLPFMFLILNYLVSPKLRQENKILT